jgi:hypothetical protein
MARAAAVDTIDGSLRSWLHYYWSLILRSFFLRHARLIRTHGWQAGSAALVVLAVMAVSLTFIYVELAAAQSPMVASFGPAPIEFVDAGSLAVASLAASAEAAGPDCAICSASTNGDAVFAIPPVFLLPQAVELLHRTTDSTFARLRSRHAKSPS